MKNDTTRLIQAQINRFDEFYTLRKTIEKEMAYWPDLFRNKTVYCNCDSDESEFVRYFQDNFEGLGLKSLIYSHYNPNGCGQYTVATKSSAITESFKGNGDFRSEECVELLRKADIVVTNPPFSLQRDFIKLMFDEHKDYLIIGNMNNLLTKTCEPYIGSFCRFGYSVHSGGFEFKAPCNVDWKSDNVHIKNGI